MSGLLMSQREKTSSICSVSKLYVLSTVWNSKSAGDPLFDKKCYECCPERRRSPDPTPVRSLSIVMLLNRDSRWRTGRTSLNITLI